MADIAYTVRLAPALLQRIEQAARARGVSPHKLVRAVLAERFGGNQKSEFEEMADGPTAQRDLRQILLDLTRTRLTLQHLLDHQLGSEVTDSIRKVAQSEAEGYVRRLDGRWR